VLNLLEYDLPLQEAVDAPRIWTAVAHGDAAVNPGFTSAIQPLRDMGHVMPHAGNVAKLPTGGNAIGSAGSFGVNLATFGLVGGEDSTRFPDATTAIVARR